MTIGILYAIELELKQIIGSLQWSTSGPKGERQFGMKKRIMLLALLGGFAFAVSAQANTLTRISDTVTGASPVTVNYNLPSTDAFAVNLGSGTGTITGISRTSSLGGAVVGIDNSIMPVQVLSESLRVGSVGNAPDVITVPDGGSAVALLGIALAGIEAARRMFRARKA